MIVAVGEGRGYNIYMKLCKKCQKPLTGNQLSYCSPRCSKLHLKSLYKKRNREKINAYNREYKKRGIGGNPSTNGIIKSHIIKYPSCEKCGTMENVNACHVKPRWAGGRNKDNLISLCDKHHYQFDALLRMFWK